MNLLELSQTIRRVRQAQKMTLEVLAKRSGFSKGFISQVENFRTTPSLKALEKIAGALGVGIGDLFTGNNAGEEFSFSRLDEGEELERDDSDLHGIRYLALAYRQPGRKMDPFILEYTEAEPRKLMFHDSEEFFAVLEGSLDYFIYDDLRPRRMNPGDTVYLKANIPHRAVLAPGCSRAKALVVYSEPAGLSAD